MPVERQVKRRRGAVACLRCKSRKHRCDNEYPSCGACLSASEVCIYGNESCPPTGYVKSLEDRLQALEHHLLPQSASRATEQDVSVAGQHREASNELQHQSMATSTLQEQTSSSESSDILPPNPYLGLSSGFPLATMMQTVISPAEKTSDTTIVSNAWLPAQSSQDRSRARPASDKSSSVVIAKSIMPDADESERLVAAYLYKVHVKHPFLSPHRVRKLAESRHKLRPASHLCSDMSRESSLDYCILHLIYAIGARYLQLSEEYDYRPPVDHYMAASVDTKLAHSRRGLESLEVMILLSIYQLRSSGESGIWSVVGTTMRKAVDYGMHRASNNPPLLDQRRKRIFWTIYMLERSVAVTLGRPLSISERDIDIDLPANVPDDIDDEQQMLKAVQEATITPSQIHAISPALHIFRLQRIISRIQYTVHRVDRATSSIDMVKISHLRAALEEWKAKIKDSVPLVDEHEAPNPYVTLSYHVLQYHKAMLFLLLPTLTWLPISHPDFRVCATAAGQIGQLYRNSHNTQSPRISFSLLALHANLVAGLTLVYCFVADPMIFDAKFSSDIRACSTVLYIIAERWPAARRARDCFERFVQASVERSPQTSGSNADHSKSALDLQQVHHSDKATTTTEHVQAQATHLGITDLPQSDDIWDVLGSTLNEKDCRWLEGIDVQDFLEFG